MSNVPAGAGMTGGTGQWSLITGRVALEDLVEQGFDTLINHKARR